MPEITKRKKGESFEMFMRRAKDQWKKSGKVLQAKKIQYYAPLKSKNMRRKSALHKLGVAGKIEYLKKTGRLPEENTKKF